MKIFTIGVYGKTEDEFFSALQENSIDVFCDIRQRRGVRGRQYSFVNSVYLQNKLQELGVKYLYEKELAPTREIREKQWAEDKANKVTKKYRNILGNTFVKCYCELILDAFDLDAFVENLKELSAENIVLFCVESNPNACHRSLLAKKMAEKFDCEIINL